ncbi:E3 ubiquitin-protein ligase HAKAI homolog isoform X1 [Primulina huaijiensis]|uniref:E3 ubiquitin-protein ligase HAKAI homolog isoform X1 n=1 Tax=Primulina huaijiensis TaxID=1492673 RepID=UPI003CC78DE9
MLQIRLTKPASESGGSAKPAPADNIRVACPDHLVLADLPVTKSLGSASASAVIKTVGRRSRRQLGERVHFCVRCDFPIAIYGRLSPCEHAFCLDCARSDSLCYLCDERIQKIQTIKMMEGIFICAAPHCLKSFLKKTEFESHINEIHADLLHPHKEKEGNESEATSARKPLASDSTVQAPLRSVFSSSSNLQAHDHEDKSQRPQSRDPPPLRPNMHPMSSPHFPGKVPNHPSEQQHDNNQSQVFDRAASQIHFPQQTIDLQGGLRQDSAATNQNPVLPAPQFGYSPYVSDGMQQFFGAPYDGVRPGAMPEAGSDQVTLLGFPPGPAGPMNFAQNYPQPWNMGMVSGPLDSPLVAQGATDGFVNVSDPQGRGFYQGDYGQNVAAANKTMERRPQTLPLPPPLPSPLLSSHLSQLKQGWSYPNDGNRDAPPGFGWQTEGRDNFGGGPD